jgi:hypothetical protein
MTAVTTEKRLRLPLSWSFIESVRTTVAEHLREAAPDLREAAVMVASELAENVIKYGEPLVDEQCGYVTVLAGPEGVVIRTMNGVSSAARALEVKQRIETIAGAEDVEALFRARLQEMLESPADQRSSLGLLRIAYEGNFRLSCSYEAPVLTIVAQREWL